MDNRIRKIVLEWTDEIIINLIGLVEGNPLLWDCTLTDYKNRVKRNAAWVQIVQDLGLESSSQYSVDDATRKWQSLRCQYKDYKNKEKATKSGQGTSDRYHVRWKFFGLLKFLDCDSIAVATTSNLVSIATIFIRHSTSS